MLKEHILKIKQAISEALQNRKQEFVTGNEVQIIAVSKTRSSKEVQIALDNGIKILGENKVQEAKLKKEQVIGGSWHLIGHLQTNKIKQAVTIFSLIHSVDSERVLLEIEKQAAEQGKVQDILLQVNVAQEESKFGLAVAELLPLAKLARGLEHIKLRGIMVIGPHTEDTEQVRKIFAQGYQQFVALKTVVPEIDILSMGMSADYLIAIEEGANMVRIGSKIFGERIYR